MWVIILCLSVFVVGVEYRSFAYRLIVDFSLADAVESDINYRIFTNSKDEPQYITAETRKLAYLNHSNPTKVFIHGWTTNYTSPWYSFLKSAYFKRGFYNIIYVDWSKAGNKSYLISGPNAKPIGEYIGNFLIESKVILETVHVIGHSLGSQVASFIGKHVYKKIQKKVGRITATDPAGPGWENNVITEESRLARTDALFVDVIHTDTGHYGFIAPTGTVDFYPNGGAPLQPGCPDLTSDDNCSHARSNLLFIEAVNSKRFKAKKCSSWVKYQEGFCERNQEIVFGEDVDQQAEGTFHFKTHAEPPFAEF